MKATFYERQLVREGKMTYCSMVAESAKIYKDVDRIISSPLNAALVAKDILKLQGKPSEEFWVIALNIRNEIIGMNMNTRGNLNTSIVDVKSVLTFSLLSNANGFITVHNHPSGNSTPSPEDVRAFGNLDLASSIVGLSAFDHIIIGTDTYYSHKQGSSTAF